MFVDNIEIDLLSGAGGSGSVSFNSKSSQTSPNGANGGNGGSITFKTDSKLFDFSNLKSKGSFKADNGEDAQKNLQNGKNGEDLVLKIPLGTSIYYEGELIAELIEENVEYLKANDIHVEYLDLRSLITLEEASDKLRGCGIFIACHLDDVRLIDNIEI